MPRKKATPTVTSVTLKHINEKLNHIHKDLEQNTRDITELKQQSSEHMTTAAPNSAAFRLD